MVVLFKKLHSKARIPVFSTDGAAAADLYAIEDYTIRPNQKVCIRSGFAVKIPDGYYLEVFSRSGLASKQELIMLNSVGIIDEDYIGEIKTYVKNIGSNIIKINEGDRYAQMILKKKTYMTFKEVDELPTTERGDGGFGSTGN